MKVDVKWTGKMGFTGVSARNQQQVQMDSSAQFGREFWCISYGDGVGSPCRLFGNGCGEYPE